MICTLKNSAQMDVGTSDFVNVRRQEREKKAPLPPKLGNRNFKYFP